VADLINPITGTWDDQLVKDTFCACDANLVLNMHVRADAEDFIAWHFDSKGMHSVKQAYKLQVQLGEAEQNGGRSTSTMNVGNLDGGGDDRWRRIWKLTCPPKIKMFIWRLSHNSLALRPNLAMRGVHLDNLNCLFCNSCLEEGAHLFVKCKHVKEGWRCLGLEDMRRELAGTISIVHALDIIWRCPMETRVQIFTFWWSWWSNRNKLREGEKTITAAATAHQARCSALEYIEVLGKKSSDKHQEQIAWMPPDHDVLKFNIDGAFTPGHNIAGWGVIVRNHRGEVVAAMAGRSEYIADAFQAELTAAVKAIQLAEHLGVIHAVLETDSELLMLALNNRKTDASAQALILDELKFQIRTNFSFCNVVACKREFNRPAHELARIGWSCDVNRALLWEYEVPATIAGLVSGEMAQ
jgi:ribonuclease HI